MRPWQHVLDVSNGYALLAKKIYFEPEIYSEPFNFSNRSSTEYSTKFIIEYLNNKLNYHNYVVHSSIKTFKETKTLKLISKKAFENLGWKSELSIEESLDLTAQYYKDSSGISPKDVAVSQIREYLKRLL